MQRGRGHFKEQKEAQALAEVGIIHEIRPSDVLADFDYPQVAGEVRIPSEDGGAVFVFDRQGRHLRTDDVYTSKTLLRFDYDEAGLLARAVDYYANETRILRDDPAGDVVIESSIGDQRTILDMDENGNLREVTYPGGGAEEFSYDAGGLMTAHRNRSGDEAAYVYDQDGKLISETTPDGGTQTWTREDNFERRGWDVTHESQAGRTTRYEVSELDTGADISPQATVVQGGTEAEPEELSQMTRRLKSGIVLGETPDGTQTYTMEAADPVAGMLAPYTDFTRVLLPEDDLELSMVAQKLVERADPEDSLSRISKLITRSGVDLDNDFQTRYVADSNTEWDPAAVETLVASTTYFDEIATRTETVTAEDRWTTAFYSERGELIRTEAGTLYPSEYEYDDMGYLTRSVAAPGTADEAATEFGYNTNGLLEITTDTLGRVVTNSYDERNLLVGVDLDGEAGLGFEYDEDDILTSVTLPHGQIHRFYHDAMYRPTAYYPPALLSGDTPTTFSWNLDGQAERTDYADGSYTDAVYDFAGRLERVHGSDGLTTRTYEYGYDGSTNQLLTITGPLGADEHRLTFDRNGGLLQQVKWSGPNYSTPSDDNIAAQMDYTYGERLLVATMAAAGDAGAGDQWTNTLAYDSDNVFTTATLSRGGQTNRSYHMVSNESGLVVATKLVEGSTTRIEDTLDYDGFGQILGYASDHATTGPLANYEIEYDLLGRIDRTTESLRIPGTESLDELELDYEYNPLGGLSSVGHDGSTVRTYTYDVNGNRLSKYDVEAGSVSYYEYDAQDRLLRTTDTLNAAEFEYEYSDRGLLTAQEDSNSSDRTEYRYDAFGNLLQVTLHAGDVDESEIEYVVDGVGRRIGRKKDGAWTNKYVAGAELEADNDLVSVFMPGGMISRKDATGSVTASTWTTYKFVKDVRGSLRLVVNAATGVVVQRLDYDEYGNVLNDTLPGFQPFGFAGGIYDAETGLVQFGMRSYDARVGRWTTKDPIGLLGGWNLYAYCGNDPINLVDPSGLGWNSDNPEDVLDFIANVMNILSMVPGIGNFADAFMVGFCLVRGDFMGAALSAIGVLPGFSGGLNRMFFAGAEAGLGLAKYADEAGMLALKGADEAADAAKAANNAADIAKATPPIRNQHLAGSVHPETGIPFNAEGFPDFSGVAVNEVDIAYTGTRTGDYAAANKAAGLNATPKGYTWHHHENGRTMQLVPTAIHKATGHTGGYSLH